MAEIKRRNEKKGNAMKTGATAQIYDPCLLCLDYTSQTQKEGGFEDHGLPVDPSSQFGYVDRVCVSKETLGFLLRRMKRTEGSTRHLTKQLRRQGTLLSQMD